MNLGDFKRRAYSQAKNLAITSGFIQAGLLALSLYAAFVPGPVNSYLGLAAFVAPIVNFALRERSRHHYGFGERARRAQRLEDGLGRPASRADLLDFADNQALLPSLDPSPLESEFTSTLDKGPQRLAHVTQEAAYYSRSEATFAARMYFALTLLGLLATFGALLLLVQRPSGELAGISGPGTAWAKAAATLLVFFATGTFAERWRAFESLAKAAGATFDRCEALTRSNPSELDVVLAITGYDLALGRAPPLPSFIYRLKRPALHEAWKSVA